MNFLYDARSSKLVFCDNPEKRGVGRRFMRERTYAYLWLIHADVWQKPTQHDTANMLHIKNKFKKVKRQKILSQIKEQDKAPEKSVSEFFPAYISKVAPFVILSSYPFKNTYSYIIYLLSLCPVEK